MISETIGQHETESEFVKRLYSENNGYGLDEIKVHAKRQGLLRDIGMVKLRSRQPFANPMDIVQQTLDIQKRIVALL